MSDYIIQFGWYDDEKMSVNLTGISKTNPVATMQKIKPDDLAGLTNCRKD